MHLILSMPWMKMNGMGLNPFDIVYALDENEWNGVKSIQLLLKDLQ